MIKRLRDIFKSDDLEYEFLPPALEIESTPSPPLKVALIWLILVITLSVFLWSYFGMVDEVAVARGKIIPDGRVKVVQPMETGIIRAIHVKEGQRVKEGEVLIDLDPTIKQADADSSEKALSIHKLDRDRLVAELHKGDMSDRNSGNIFEFQKKLKNAREAEYKAKEEALRLVISQKENALHAAESILAKLEKTTSISKEQETAYKSLFEKGFTAKMDYLDKQRDYYTTLHEFEAQKKTVKQYKDSLEESKKSLDALMREREKIILSDIVDREKNITSLSAEAVKAKKKYELEKLCSPVDGTVHGLASYTIGGVVTPAQPTVTIVPFDTPLVIEAVVSNQDIGFLKPGQDAEIKLDTFPFQKYGTINGRVVWLSPDAVEDEKLGTVYKMRVEPERLKINVDGRDVMLSPGMTVSVEVKTNKRRIIEFFLSPLIKHAKESLTLR
ncbi:MAG: HlyD family type I secretion periplasmic adaptor subunit [Nitrospirae bacterium]|nr:HlyD family type I secretion periplasmic adaptor subunit [Nitrospirota bacterium]